MSDTAKLQDSMPDGADDQMSPVLERRRNSPLVYDPAVERFTTELMGGQHERQVTRGAVLKLMVEAAQNRTLGKEERTEQGNPISFRGEDSDSFVNGVTRRVLKAAGLGYLEDLSMQDLAVGEVGTWLKETRLDSTQRVNDLPGSVLSFYMSAIDSKNSPAVREQVLRLVEQFLQQYTLGELYYNPGFIEESFWTLKQDDTLSQSTPSLVQLKLKGAMENFKGMYWGKCRAA